MKKTITVPSVNSIFNFAANNQELISKCATGGTLTGRMCHPLGKDSEDDDDNDSPENMAEKLRRMAAAKYVGGGMVEIARATEKVIQKAAGLSGSARARMLKCHQRQLAMRDTVPLDTDLNSLMFPNAPENTFHAKGKCPMQLEWAVSELKDLYETEKRLPHYKYKPRGHRSDTMSRGECYDIVVAFLEKGIHVAPTNSSLWVVLAYCLALDVPVTVTQEIAPRSGSHTLCPAYNTPEGYKVVCWTVRLRTDEAALTGATVVVNDRKWPKNTKMPRVAHTLSENLPALKLNNVQKLSVVEALFGTINVRRFGHRYIDPERSSYYHIDNEALRRAGEKGAARKKELAAIRRAELAREDVPVLAPEELAAFGEFVAIKGAVENTVAAYV